MGAYGHSRVREFILGGATKFICVNAPVPVLLSHRPRPPFAENA